jgi:hypothetical protein
MKYVLTDKQKIYLLRQCLKTLRKDAKMALSGEWDCTTQEGKEGFDAQVEAIDRALEYDASIYPEVLGKKPA